MDYTSLIFNYCDDTASFSGAVSSGILEIVGIEIFNENAQSSTVANKKTFLMQTGSLPGLKNGSVMTVNTITYSVDRIQPEQDGKVSRVYLQNH